MKNPLSPKYSEEDNRKLVKRALDGDRDSLDELIHLHQPFIYNVAWKMSHDPDDAMDLTQETLLKVITKLAQFNFKSSFRTWLYRIVVNEFLQAQRGQRAIKFQTFEEYGAALDSIPNPDLTKEEEISLKELSREMQIRCLSGMLMCLNREQRLIYILGETFGIDHNIGAEIFNISKQNFRVKLHRTRKDLYNFMEGKCGLVNKSNPCRCPKKTKFLKSQGLLDEAKMQFNIEHKQQISDYAHENYEEVADKVNDKYYTLFRQHPTREDFDKKSAVRAIIEDRSLEKIFST
ncbi:MAG: RNA polymerase sigma factor [Bacteroidia bacterium]|nr:RNA polymerase sigma factor [Bacteroidia bacterium]